MGATQKAERDTTQSSFRWRRAAAVVTAPPGAPPGEVFHSRGDDPEVVWFEARGGGTSQGPGRANCDCTQRGRGRQDQQGARPTLCGAQPDQQVTWPMLRQQCAVANAARCQSDQQGTWSKLRGGQADQQGAWPTLCQQCADRPAVCSGQRCASNAQWQRLCGAKADQQCAMAYAVPAGYMADAVPCHGRVRMQRTRRRLTSAPW